MQGKSTTKHTKITKIQKDLFSFVYFVPFVIGALLSTNDNILNADMRRAH
jgi:hypothetical protein